MRFCNLPINEDVLYKLSSYWEFFSTIALAASPDFTFDVNSYNLKFTAQISAPSVADAKIPTPGEGAKMVQATVSAGILAAFTSLC